MRPTTAVGDTPRRKRFSRLIRDTTFQVSAQYISVVSQLAKGIVLARLLGPGNLGSVAAIGVVVAYAAYADLGVSYAIGREIPMAAGAGDADRARSMYSYGVVMRVVGALIVGFALFAASFLAVAPADTDMRFGLMSAGAMILFGGVTATQLAVLTAQQRFRAAAWVSISMSLGSLTLTVLGAWRGGVRGVFIAQVIAYVLTALLSTGFAGWPPRVRYRLPELRHLVALGLSLGLLAFVGYNLVAVDQVMIMSLLGKRDLGLYAIVLAGGGAVQQLPAALAATVGPRLLRRFGESPEVLTLSELTWRPVAFISTYLTPVLALVWVAAPLLVRYVLPAYSASVGPLRVYVCGVYFLGVNLGVSTTLFALNRYRVNIPILCACIGFNAAVDYALVRHFGLGLVGIALGSAVTYVAYWFVHTSYVRHLFGVRARALLLENAKSTWPGLAVLVLTLWAAYVGQLTQSGLFDAAIVGVALAAVAVRRARSTDGLAATAGASGKGRDGRCALRPVDAPSQPASQQVRAGRKCAEVVPLVDIVVVTYNRARSAAGTVRSCLELDYPDFRVVVVDNGSTDDTCAELVHEFAGDDRVQVVAVRPNQGFAAGVNAGLLRAMSVGTDYVLILGDDVELDPGSLRELLRAAESRPRAGIVSPLIFYADRRDVIWYAGGYHRPLTGRTFHRGMNGRGSDQFTEVEEVGYAVGCAALVSTDAVAEVGLMDVGYFLYCEDCDWSGRMRAAGRAVLFAPRARVWHKATPATDTRVDASVYYRARNTLLLTLRSHPWRLPFVLGWQGQYIARCLLRGRASEARLIALGVRDFVRRCRGPMPPEYAEIRVARVAE